MNIDPESYVVMEREALIDMLSFIGGKAGMREHAEEWVEENEIPLMTIPQFQKDIVENSIKWFPDAMTNSMGAVQIDLVVTVLGIAGEAGEVADVLKKVARGSITLEEARSLLAEESIDLFHYLCMLWVALQIDPSEEYSKKTLFNDKRFGNHPSTRDN